MNPIVKKEYNLFREKMNEDKTENDNIRKIDKDKIESDIRNDSLKDFTIYLSSFLPSQKYMSMLLNSHYTDQELENMTNEIYDVLIFKKLY